jgi:Uma2 family endonuclease
MATTPSLLSIDEYLQTGYHPDVHYVDGEIEERNLGQYDHGKIQAFIAYLFMQNAKAWNTDVITELRIRVAPRRVRVCDVAVLRSDAPREQVTLTPPLLCIEILSPEDRLPRASLVLADYLAMGVPNIWLVDPANRAAFTFDATGLHPADPTRLTVPGTPIHLDLSEAFAAIG